MCAFDEKAISNIKTFNRNQIKEFGQEQNNFKMLFFKVGLITIIQTSKTLIVFPKTRI